jgi:hypothetical protein
MANRTFKFDKLVAKTAQFARAMRYATPVSGAEWAGVTGVASSTVPITTTAVASGAMVTLTLRTLAANSGDVSMPAWVVRSINPGTGFVIGTVCSYALTSSYQAHWTLAAKV